MRANDSTVEEATGNRTDETEPPARLSEFTGKPQYADYVYVGTDSEGSHHYYSDLTGSIEVLEDDEIVWHESNAPLDEWIAHIRDERGWTTIDRDGPAGAITAATTAREGADT